MASAVMIKKIADHYQVDPVKHWVQRALMDFTDNEVAGVMKKYHPATIWDLYDALVMQTDNPEIHAHLLGFASAEERAQMNEAFRTLQEANEREIKKWK